jgi:DNA-binding transcriptional MerR regulator
VRIGEVHKILREEFPDLELSTIRYYEDQGLVQPSRTKSGYRTFNDNDVACLREALRLVRDKQMRLSQVRVRLIGLGLLHGTPTRVAPTRHAARTVADTSVTLPVAVPTREATPTPRTTPVTRPLSGDEFRSSTGLSDQHIASAIDAGLLVPEAVFGDYLFTPDDVTVGASLAALLAHGIDARRIAATKRVVERSAGLLGEMQQSAPSSVPLDALMPHFLQMYDAMLRRDVDRRR